MNQNTMEVYAEVYAVLNLMDKEYVSKIPTKLIQLFDREKSKTYNIKIDPNKPLQLQNLKQETLTILAVLNYNFWCTDEKHKKELLELYSKNEIEYQKELKEKYNPDNLFRKNKNTRK